MTTQDKESVSCNFYWTKSPEESFISLTTLVQRLEVRKAQFVGPIVKNRGEINKPIPLTPSIPVCILLFLLSSPPSYLVTVGEMIELVFLSLSREKNSK